MKVLFAVNNDNISNAIIKKYQEKYKEIITSKNVYYYNAILMELQKDKSYDRVVISEDVEPYANNNYDKIDKFLFERLDKISDEATKANGENIEIILICSDRRSKSDEMMTKIFGIGIYNALLGDDRNIDNLCKLINQPRTKKEAKAYYRIEGNNVGYQVESENNVSEAEVQNILAHYKRLGKDEDRYVDSFNNIVSQYTDTQLRIIIRYLPINVKAVLEERSPKYQELSTFANQNSKKSNMEPYTSKSKRRNDKKEKIKVQMLKNEKEEIAKPIVIPSTLRNKPTTIIGMERQEKEVVDNEESGKNRLEEEAQKIVKRGRPRKNNDLEIEEDKPKRRRGRPKKESVIQEEPETDPEIDLFNLDFPEEEKEEEIDLFNMGDETQNELDLYDDNSENEEQNGEIDLFSLDESQEENNNNPENNQTENINLFNVSNETKENDEYINRSITQTNIQKGNLDTILTREKKIVTFVGTTKNGTSFVVNNLALMLSSMNISTAILDTTKNKNAYYIFTKNEERLRKLSEESINKLEKGVAQGIEVNKNLTVYTEVPGEEKEHQDIESILVTLMEKYKVVLIDADFDTPKEYFEMSQEMYLVQSMDVLTIQPLTAFLRDLKSKNILRQEKIRIVINKEQKVRSLSTKILIGGISSYNNPSMTLMTELFDKDKVPYCKIPFDMVNYAKYLDTLVNCELSLRGYSKQLLEALNELAEIVYPVINHSKYVPPKKKTMEFSDSTKNILNKMKNNY